VLWARHETTNAPAPIVPHPDGNIIVWQAGDKWFYRLIAALERPEYTGQGYRSYLNHFADCPARARFRKAKAK
jgi:hypothetical protein